MTEERWQLVPVELTQAMLDATCGTEEDDAAMCATWAELLRAAPSPTPAADEVEAREIADPRVAALVEAAKAIVENDRQAMDILRKADVPIDPRNFRLSEALHTAIAALQARSAEPAPVSREIAEWNAARDAGCSQDAAIARVRALPAEPAGEEPVAWLYINPRTGWRNVITEKRSGDWVRYEQVTETPLYARPSTNVTGGRDAG